VADDAVTDAAGYAREAQALGDAPEAAQGLGQRDPNSDWSGETKTSQPAPAPPSPPPGPTSATAESGAAGEDELEWLGRELATAIDTRNAFMDSLARVTTERDTARDLIEGRML